MVAAACIEKAGMNGYLRMKRYVEFIMLGLDANWMGVDLDGRRRWIAACIA